MSTASPAYGRMYPQDVTDRLQRLISVTSQLDPSWSFPERSSGAVNTCLQTVETLLADPTHEPAQPRQTGEQTVKSEARWDTKKPASQQSPNDDVSRQLRVMSESLTTLTQEFHKRRAESRRINSVFESKYDAVSQEAQLLKHVLRTTKADAEEAEVKLEGLNGTVRGLETWFTEWDSRHDGVGPESWEALLHSSKRKVSTAQVGMLREEMTTLVDGISAWLRGWKDVEEAFNIRPK